MTRRAPLVLALLALAAVLTACGAGAGGASPGVRLTVTDDFGRETLVEQSPADTASTDTVMRVLQRYAEVDTRYGGGFVQAIDKLSAGREDGRQLDWFFYVNGILADEGAAATKIHAGDRVWWDRHDWTDAMHVPAVVGSFPEPFVNGLDGKRIPTRIECDDAVEAACDVASDRLADLGVVAAKSRPLTDGGVENLRVVVGLWPNVRDDRALRLMDGGPDRSGVFARFSDDGRTLTALGPDGKPVRELGPGTGLVAALRHRDDAPTWFVGGTDVAGVRAAAEALDETVLAEKFALAISDGLPVALPATEAER